ncbi:MAG: chromosomal replication initiator protein DnaA [Candidatus Nanopelagicales bacterium]|nr:chromosomal replication initiator protein DnaA [Candidatus Nanopelagicales bacterium]
MDTTVDLSGVWGEILTEVTGSGVGAHQRGILALTHPVGILGDTVLIAVPNEFTKDTVETKHREPLSRSISRRLGQPIRVAVTVDPTLAPGPDDYTTDVVADATYAGPVATTALAAPARTSASPFSHTATSLRPGRGGPGASPAFGSRNGFDAGPNRSDETRLNPRYTFDTFVIGSSNRFAHAAAVAAAEQPAKAYNPLIIYGGSGLGKTHLLHAIGHYNRELYKGSVVRYVSSEEFTNQFINSIRDDKAAAFQRRYRDIDLLLVDDIQFLSGKVQTQEEFFHTFNTLHNSDKQIVVTSDIHPRQLPDFEDRMRSRFEWGLITDVQPPDLETRIAILRKKTRQERMNVHDDVLEFIADRISNNIRELEGALIRVTAYASLNATTVTREMAQDVLKDLISDHARPNVSAGLIMAHASQYYGVTIDDLCGPSRSRSLVTARQVAMYLCRELTDLSFPKVGQEFGGRDHTTVMHAERKIRKEISQRRSLFNQVTDLTGRIKSEARLKRAY